MPLTIKVSADTEAWLANRAKATGQDLPTYVSGLVERIVAGSKALNTTLAPIRQAFDESGMTDDELGDMLEDLKHAARADRPKAAAGHG